MSADAAPADASLMPPSVAQVAAVVGWPAALAMVEAWPGQTLALPMSAGAGVWPLLEPVIGPRACALLRTTYGGGVLYIPACSGLARAETTRRIREEVRHLERTQSTRAAVAASAHKWRCSDRTIWRALAQQTTATEVAPAIGLVQIPLI